MQQNIQLENKWTRNISPICLTFLLWEKRSFVGFVGGWGIYANNFFQRWCILNTNDANTRATNKILHNKCQTAQTKTNRTNIIYAPLWDSNKVLSPNHKKHLSTIFKESNNFFPGGSFLAMFQTSPLPHFFLILATHRPLWPSCLLHNSTQFTKTFPPPTLKLWNCKIIVIV